MKKQHSDSTAQHAGLEDNLKKLSVEQGLESSTLVKTSKKKSAGKKNPDKPISGKKINSQSLLKSIPPEKYFVLCDGRVIKTIEELAGMLESMSDEVYAYHANANKNDFSTWIAGVFADPKLAEKIRHKSRTGMLFQLHRYLHLEVKRK